MPTFEVSAATPTVRLDGERHGAASFTITNRGATLLHGRAAVSPAAPAELGWFAVQGDVQRAFAPGAPEPCSVEIAVPPGGPPGRYAFSLEVVGIENPDEDSAISGQVTFEVHPIPIRVQPPTVGKGYLAAFAGSVAGGLVGSLVGTLPGVLILISVLQAHPGSASDAGHVVTNIVTLLVGALVGLLAGLLGGLIGLVLGPLIGCWVGLRSRGYRAVGPTLGVLAVLQVVWTVVLLVVWGVVFGSLKQAGPQVASALAALVLALLVPPLPARALALRIAGRR